MTVAPTSLTNLSTACTWIEREFELEAVRRLKETSVSDLSIGGAGIAAEAFRHGLVDECAAAVPGPRRRQQAGPASRRTTRGRAA